MADNLVPLIWCELLRPTEDEDAVFFLDISEFRKAPTSKDPRCLLGFEQPLSFFSIAANKAESKTVFKFFEVKEEHSTYDTAFILLAISSARAVVIAFSPACARSIETLTSSRRSD